LKWSVTYFLDDVPSAQVVAPDSDATKGDGNGKPGRRNYAVGALARIVREEPFNPPASQTICQQTPDGPRTMPIRFIKRGAIHVALSSKTVLTARATSTCSESYPT